MKHVSPAQAFLGATALTRPRAIVGNIRADASDPKAMMAELKTAFEAFKAANDDKLKAKADVVVSEKVDRIDAAVGNFQQAIDDLNAKLAASSLGSAPDESGLPVDPEYRKAFSNFFRTGDGEAEIKAAQKTPIRAAMSVGSNTDGGYFAPVEWDRTVTGKLKLISPIRQNAKVQTISTAGFSKVFTDRAVGSGWVGETASRPATSTPQLAVLTFTPGELYAFPQATQQLLEDAVINVEEWLASEVETEFARQEGIAFLSGDGSNKPFGILTYVTGAANAAKHPWGAITTINSGAAAAFTSDGFISLFYDLPQAFSGNAKLYTNRLSQSGMRKLKDGQGNYLWQPSFQLGQPATLAGVPIVDVPDMPNVGAGNVAALYGDMDATYMVIDRVGISVLRDPYSNKPYVGFYTRKRVGGGVYNPQPMRALVISA